MYTQLFTFYCHLIYLNQRSPNFRGPQTILEKKLTNEHQTSEIIQNLYLSPYRRSPPREWRRCMKQVQCSMNIDAPILLSQGRYIIFCCCCRIRYSHNYTIFLALCSFVLMVWMSSVPEILKCEPVLNFLVFLFPLDKCKCRD